MIMRHLYHEIEHLSPTLYKIRAKHPDTYLTMKLNLFHDIQQFGDVTDADLWVFIQQQHRQRVIKLSEKCMQSYHNREMPLSEFYRIYAHSNAEELTQLMSTIRVVDELLAYRINFEIVIEPLRDEHSLD